jgi:radical SAM protein with 4Fe4S-binding SPASM domain
MKKEYLKENSDLFKNFLETTFFYNWRNSNRAEQKLLNYGSIEMSIGYACDLKCTYCYYSRYGKELYQNKPVKASDIIENTEKLMNFICKNNMFMKVDLFSGDPFNLPYIWDWFDVMYKYISKTPIEKRIQTISIPTNLSFLRRSSDDHLIKLKEYLHKFREINVDLGLSGSCDGPFMDKFNRPTAKEFEYSKNFYEDAVHASKELMFGFHPMIYSYNIENWIDNFLWFYYLTDQLYLLEVRNAEWTEEQSRQLFFFMKFIIHFLFQQAGKNKEEFFKMINKTNRGYNILLSPFMRIGRGMGCSMQSTLNFQMNDLSIIPCHRTSYDELVTGKFIPNEDGSYDFEPKNVEYYIAEHSTVITRTHPCVSCNVNEICPGGCLGSNYESTGDVFTHHPNMCRMEHYKIAGIVTGLKEIDCLSKFADNTDLRRKSQVENILKIFGEENGY